MSIAVLRETIDVEIWNETGAGPPVTVGEMTVRLRPPDTPEAEA